ncbi:restriction endonuclease subunit S [Phocaeicola vulgatus]|uniref:Restriction endonuclease subunit S n=1 Tax=Phocaeicola vulgatus TaxID=821 RepID=A0A9W7R7C7_PHOVU|nr:restriction endonuclease subunit S [Phocaeicola vulgatus]KAB3549899.1 restriction endonuclease subunit S [Phocaeicola vulgatus]KAB3632212.1 restriction endonuclease subunit S [Phocaeicola vulgatus]KAB3641755.1 restriction endonuclease subunit S [Phocaeicola vulgatus]KAB3651219.1 restriction endonuclease subunit S [Phocaeicola vulgatus]
MIRETKCLDVPHLRFPEFSEEWEICKVSELLDFYSTNSLSWEQLEYGTKAMMNLHYGLIHVGLPTMVDLTRDNLPNIKEDNMPKNFELCKEGDVAFADASEDTNEVAKPIEFFDLAGKNIVCGLHTIHGRDNKNKTVIGFKGYAFSSSAFHNQIRRIAQGTKIYSISTKNFSECFIGIPSKVEQTKIATLLRLIDERIATQNKIIEKLQSLIKGLAVALTTKEKANIAISQCLECHSSTLQESEVLSSGLCKVFGANGLVGYKDVPQMNGDAILVIKDGSGVGTVSYAQGKFSVIGTLNYLTVIGNNDLRYLYFALSVFNFQPYKTGMAIPHIYFKDYGKAKIYCPSLAEQKRVANVLDKLESKLFVEQELLASFNQQKLYLLGKMFI